MEIEGVGRRERNKERGRHTMKKERKREGV